MGALPAKCGAVAEWSKALAWKVSIRQNRIEGSNPSRSAKDCSIAVRSGPPQSHFYPVIKCLGDQLGQGRPYPFTPNRRIGWVRAWHARSKCMVLCRSSKLLSDAKIRAAKPRQKPYKLADSHQLYLCVSAAGGKLWRMNQMFDGKQRTLSIGPYPLISLAEARA